MNPKLIVIDGKTYTSVDEMPEDIRWQYEEAMRNLSRDRMNAPQTGNLDPFADKNNANSPDAFGNLAALQQTLTANPMSAAQFVVNGQTYNSLEQLPPEVRAQYEQAMGNMDANRNGIPDFVENMFNINTPAQTTSTAAADFNIASPGHASSPFHTQHKPKITTSTIEPESSANWLLILAGIALLGLCLVATVAGVWYFFLR